jgi:hypothetical protein
MKHLLVGVYHFCSNRGPGVKIGLALVIIDFPYIYVYGKNLKNLPFITPQSYNLDM